MTDATIAAAGLRSETSGRVNAMTLNWRSADRLGPCLVFQFRHLDGTVNGFARLRPDKPLDGWKYEQPKGEGRRAYFPFRTTEALNTPRIIVGFVSHADMPAMQAAGTSLVVVTTHKSAEEVVEEVKQAGLTAEAYPKLTPGSEKEMPTSRRAESRSKGHSAPARWLHTQ